MPSQITAMNSRIIPTIFLWICILSFFCIVNQAELAKDCCLSVSKKEIGYRYLKGYEIQDKSNGCTIDAVVLFTRKGFKICAPGTEEWVKKIIARMDKEIEKCKSNTHKDRNCKRLRAPGLAKRQ